MYARPEERNPEQRSFSMALYMITAFSGIMQGFNEVTVILGMLLVMLCFFMIKAQKLTAMGTIYATHVEWTRRTLFIGTFFLFPLAMSISLYLVYTSTDITALKKSIADADSADLGVLIDIVKTYIAKNLEKVQTITSWCLAPAIFWWVRRCWFGFRKAKESEPIDYPDGLL